MSGVFGHRGAGIETLGSLEGGAPPLLGTSGTPAWLLLHQGPHSRLGLAISGLLQ